MSSPSKLVSSLLLASSILALTCSTSYAQTAPHTLSWHDAPIMGSNVDFSAPGQLTVTVNGNPAVIPDSNTLPSQSIFTYNPTTFGNGHFFDPTMSVWAASSVNVDLGSDYIYTGNWAFLGNGQNAAYSFDWPTNVWLGSWGHTVAELYNSVTEFWLEDAGNWQYTETWTGTSGNDAGVSITGTQFFTVALPSQVPEPASLALLGLGLAGLGFCRRKKA